MAKKKWMLVKNHDGVGHGVYVRDIPAVVASAVGETVREWWDENSGNVFWLSAGILIGMLWTVACYE
ncbi:MAG: hypothetical protein IJ510_01675 [Selenomonadales bacterium]|nr:hypothetical protein [Selenomonadales bacterium]